MKRTMLLLFMSVCDTSAVLAISAFAVLRFHHTAKTSPHPRGPAGAVFGDCRACPEMVVLPAGSFTIGSSAEEKSWAASHGGGMYAVEVPQHQVFHCRHSPWASMTSLVASTRHLLVRWDTRPGNGCGIGDTAAFRTISSYAGIVRACFM